MKKELTPEEFEARFAQRVKELIPKCRYYHGEAEEPTLDNGDGLLWFYEKCWVNDLARSYRSAESFRRDYNELQLGNLAEETGVPKSLIGLLSNRYMHWVGCYDPVNDHGAAFKRWFRKHYLKISE